MAKLYNQESAFYFNLFNFKPKFMQEFASNWLAVYTRPKWEKRVAGLLSRQNIENYCPLNKVQRQWSDRKKIIEVPLFTSYVFVRITNDLYSEVRKIPGVINFVYWLGMPAIIKNEEIDTIKRFLKEYQNVRLEKAKVDVNDQVRILSGPFLSQEGKVMEVRHKNIKVLLPNLGYALMATVNKTNVQKVASSKNAFSNA